MNKNLITFVALALAAAGAAVAQTSAPALAATDPAAAAPITEPASSSWTFTPAFASQYMFRGVRLGGPSFQPSLELDTGNLAVGVWSNFPLRDKVNGQSDPEIDFYGSYALEFVKDTLSFQPGYTIYTYPNAHRNNGFYRATFEPNLAINYTILGLKLTPKLYYDFILKGPTAELNAAYTVPLKDAGTELDFTGAIGTYIWKSAAAESNPDVKNWGDYWLVGVSLPFQVTKESKFLVGAAYTKGSNNYLKQGSDGKVYNGAAVGRGVFTLSYAITY